MYCHHQSSTGFQDESYDMQYQLFDPLLNKWQAHGMYYNCPLFYFDCVAINNKVVNFGIEAPGKLKNI
ncbi:hypothetical protein PRIPAC_75648 [Pristionchus pacificus]|uniref:Uncharacterized protein n=1 Tax=Pristionchus pacificus TaxID=54126 RepID=A0A2A6CRB0_PRIPA|nr:hypothetical protein PRIPAC_75648 [Pristionchus pacificus]|eukprot:PDM80628.1 hypothetical protein PRIPAC_35631 [Pristionchus pacificus]